MAGPKHKNKKTSVINTKLEDGGTYKQIDTPSRRLSSLTKSKSGPQSSKTSLFSYDKINKKGNLDTFTEGDVTPNKKEINYQLGQRSDFRKGKITGSTQRKSGAGYSGSEDYNT